MEKLIELLDKFRRENKTEELIGEPWTLVPLTWEDFIEMNRVMIISKEYKFIQRLVENDKIYLEKLRDLDIADNFNYEYFNKNKTDFLISLLSISDTPIEDLISYLK